MFVLSCGFCGCAKTPNLAKESIDRNIPIKIIVLPFTGDVNSESRLTWNIFFDELAKNTKVGLVDRQEIHDDLIKSLGINHPESFGSIDFIDHPQGAQRRKKIQEMFNVEFLILGSYFHSLEEIQLNIQVLDLKKGEVVVNFTDRARVAKDNQNDSREELIQECLPKVMSIIK